MNQDLTVFQSNKLREINIIRTEILHNAQRAKDTMVENANSTLRPLTLQKHDYVFVHNENVHKLQNKYSGPFAVHNIPSAHTVLLMDPVTNKIFDSSVHINRVKKAIVREPTPSDFFNVVSSRQIAQKDCQILSNRIRSNAKSNIKIKHVTQKHDLKDTDNRRFGTEMVIM